MSGLGDIVTMQLPTNWTPEVPFYPLVFPVVQQVLGQRNYDGLVLFKDQNGTVQGVYPNQIRRNADGSFTLFDLSGFNPLAKLIQNSNGTVSVIGTYPQASVGVTPAQYYAGTGQGQADYGVPGAVVPGDSSPETWPMLNVPGVALLQRPGSMTLHPEPVLPDSMLPLALRRSNPLLQRVPFRSNPYDAEIKRESDFWSWVGKNGGLRTCCKVSKGEPNWDGPDWSRMPAWGEKFEKMAAQPLSAFETGGVFNGTDVAIVQFTVPKAYDGVINRLVFGFTGNGFADFTGSIVWRAKVGSRFVRNMGNVQNAYGSFQSAFLVPGSDNIRLVSGQTVTLYGNIPAGSQVQGGQVTAGAFGWFSPRK